MRYRLGLDLGTNSIGWAVVEIDGNDEPVRIEKLGSRIFTDGRNPKDQTTLAAHRRAKRHERRRRDRFLQRKKVVLNQLVSMGLFPKNAEEQQNLKSLDVLTLRAAAVDKKISAHELGRVFYYLNLRRGFKSSRKGGSAEDKANKISERIANLKKEMEKTESKTVGQYLHSRYVKGFSTKATKENDFHLLRSLLEEEFDLIVDQQRKHYPQITIDQWTMLRTKMFHQRPLKPVETGPCAIYPSDQSRTYRYMPSFEYYRLFGELYNLTYLDKNYKDHALTNEQIFSAFEQFKHDREISYTKLKKFLKIPQVEFKIEKSKKLIKNSVSNYFFSKPEHFGDSWAELSLEFRDKITEQFFSEEPIEVVQKNLISLGISSKIVESLPDSWPSGVNDATCAYSSMALRRIVELIFHEKRHPLLIVESLVSNEKIDQTKEQKLPYYGSVASESMQPIPKHIQDGNPTLNSEEKRYGKIANPTVHAALNQVRAVVNDIIDQYGAPAGVHVELARDLKRTQEQKIEDSKKQKKNEELNAKIRDYVEKDDNKPTAFNMEKYKLWFELDDPKICVYSGKKISQRAVLTDEVEVDHILPFSRTLDDGLSNKVLVFASENAKKGNKTPFEAFHKDEKKWAEILERADKLPDPKKWRFAPDAIKKFEQNDQFLQRHLNDTRYISKIAKKYLASVVESNKVVATKGTMTHIIRGRLGLSKLIEREDGTKNRDDHRHHAVDALVVALTSRSYLQQISIAAGNKKKDFNRIPIHKPWDSFIEDAREKFKDIIVSHKVDHGLNGPFMEETCFGIVQNPNEFELENDFKLVTTQKVDSLKSDVTIRDTTLRHLNSELKLSNYPEVKKLRVYKASKEKLANIGSHESGLSKIVHGKNKEHVKSYKKNNNHLAIWYLDASVGLKSDNFKKRKTDYIFTPIKTLDLNAAKSYNDLKPHPAAKLVCKLFIDDTIIINQDNVDRVLILKSININESNNRLEFVDANLGKSVKSVKIQIPQLVNVKFRKVFVSAAGNIKDSGPILK